MPRYFALLRGINVGGHRIKMDKLREMIEALGFEQVEIFIASGNVILSSASRNIRVMEERIARHLHTALSESPLFGMGLTEETRGAPTTMGNMRTVRRLAAKYPA